jgi:uncharacterized membrane protein
MNSNVKAPETNEATVTLSNIGISYIRIILFVVIRNASNQANQRRSFRNNLSCFWLLLLLHLQVSGLTAMLCFFISERRLSYFAERIGCKLGSNP